MSDRSRRSRRVVGIARHGRLKRSNSYLNLLKLVSVGLTVVVVSTGAVAAIALSSLTQKIDDNAIDISVGQSDAPAPEIGSYRNGFNILMVGVDNDAAQGAAYGERDATLNDVNILVHVSADHTNAVVVSIPRDLIVAHPECTDADTGETYSAMSARPVNEAMSRGGLPCVVQTVAALTGLDIPFAGLITFSGVVQMSDAVGGVPICLSAPIDDPYSGLNLPGGPSVVSGENALAFLRSRKGVGDRSDLARITSQQMYMASLMRTVKSNGTLTNIPTLINLANAAASNIRLSTNLADVNTMVSMALALKDIDLARLLFVQYPGSTGDPDFPDKVVPRQDVADELFAKIAADEPFSLPEVAPNDSTGEPAPDDTPDGNATAEPSPAASGEVGQQAPDAPVPVPPLDGLAGQTAQDQSCAQAFID